MRKPFLFELVEGQPLIRAQTPITAWLNDADSPFPKRIPKYKAPDFMQKEIELFLRARNETVLMRRNGDDDRRSAACHR